MLIPVSPWLKLNSWMNWTISRGCPFISKQQSIKQQFGTIWKCISQFGNVSNGNVSNVSNAWNNLEMYLTYIKKRVLLFRNKQHLQQVIDIWYERKAVIWKIYINTWPAAFTSPRELLVFKLLSVTVVELFATTTSCNLPQFQLLL